MRTPWRRDRDRIIHCGAFRRLEYKTQVFIFHEGDHYRTRLTHSMEVAQVARSMAVALGLNESFVEALALAHDLGHPPFGHAGEDALRECMRAHGGFEHNAQALRVVDWLEHGYPAHRGLNLTTEIRSSLLKHGPTATDGIGDDLTWHPVPYLEAQLVDCADRIAYNNHDLDDGLRSGLFTASDLDELAIWRRAIDAARRLHGALDPVDRVRCARAQVIKTAIADLIEHSSRQLDNASPSSPDEARDHAWLIGHSPTLAPQLEALHRFLHARLYRAPSVLEVRRRCTAIVKRLVSVYTRHPEELAPDYRENISRFGVARSAADYVAGMTDRFAEQEHERLKGTTGKDD